MLASALRRFLLLEIAVYAVLAHAVFALGPALALAAAIGCCVGSRATFIGTTFLFAAAHHSPAPRLGAWRALLMALGEFAACCALFLVIQPFERLWMGGERLPRGRRVVLLVHGYGCNRGAWWWLRRRLEADGYAVATVSLEPLDAGIDAFVPLLHQRIEDACRDAGRARLQLVGHSMGGLVARAYLQRHGHLRVCRLVTLASPHGGSLLARFGLGANARQMRPGSPWLAALPPLPDGLRAIALRASHDNFVLPQDHQRLPGATDVELPGLGHLALLFSRRAARALGVALAAD